MAKYKLRDAPRQPHHTDPLPRFVRRQLRRRLLRLPDPLPDDIAYIEHRYRDLLNDGATS